MKKAKPSRVAKKLRIEVIPRAQLAKIISRIISEKELSQTSASSIVGEAQSQISLLMSGRMAGFSTDRLVRMLMRLGRDVDVVVSNAGRRGRPGRVRVVERGGGSGGRGEGRASTGRRG